MSIQPTTIIGESPLIAEALDHLSALAQIHRPVLILGERGTGKELAAERLHFLSPLWEGPYIRVNCAAMAETLLESELFGHEAGAFTGASRQHVGRFERADGGTLLLDEIGTTTPRLQEKLLRLIEYGEFERVGGQKTLHVDVRVIGATNADLPAMVDQGTFRADLLDRLSFDVVHIPALRLRGTDVVLLAEHFALRMSAEIGWSLFPGFSSNAVNQLSDHDWPGNVRELKNVVERSLYRWNNSEAPIDELVIDAFTPPWGNSEDIFASALLGNPQHETMHQKESDILLGERLGTEDSFDFKSRVNEFEKALLSQQLIAHSGNQKLASEALKLSYDQLRGLMRKHKLRTRRRNPKS